MKKLLVASMLYLFTTIPTLADAPPALLGKLDAGQIQKIENADEVRGKRMPLDATTINTFCNLSWNRCVQLSSASTGYLWVVYRSWTVANGWSDPRYRKF